MFASSMDLSMSFCARSQDESAARAVASIGPRAAVMPHPGASTWLASAFFARAPGIASFRVVTHHGRVAATIRCVGIIVLTTAYS